MDLQIQGLFRTKKWIRRAFKRNRRRSFSALFRNARKVKRVSFFGDYSLMSLICEMASKEKIKPSKDVILLMSQQSMEYRTLTNKKMKMMWNRSLEEICNV